jgi:hypothetical protein
MHFDSHGLGIIEKTMAEDASASQTNEFCCHYLLELNGCDCEPCTQKHRKLTITNTILDKESTMQIEEQSAKLF